MPTRLASTAVIGLEIVEPARRAPRPGAQRAPVVRLARLALVDEADDAFRQARAVVGLDAGGIERRVAPAGGDQLLGRRRIAAGRRPDASAAPAGRRLAPGCPGSPPPPNIIITGTGLCASAGVTSDHLDVDLDRRVGTSCPRAHELLADDRHGRQRSPRPSPRPSRSPSARSPARGRALRARSPRRSPAAAASTTSSAVVTFLPFFSVSASGRSGNGFAFASS